MSYEDNETLRKSQIEGKNIDDYVNDNVVSRMRDGHTK